MILSVRIQAYYIYFRNYHYCNTNIIWKLWYSWSSVALQPNPAKLDEGILYHWHLGVLTYIISSKQGQWLCGLSMVGLVIQCQRALDWKWPLLKLFSPIKHIRSQLPLFRICQIFFNIKLSSFYFSCLSLPELASSSPGRRLLSA